MLLEEGEKHKAEFAKVLKDTLKNLYSKKRVTRQDVANALGITENAVSSWTRPDPQFPTVEHFNKLCDFLEDQEPGSARRLREAAGQKETPNNLPIPLTTLIGRIAEMDEASQELRRKEVRWLTIDGLGGVGKTHFAIELGRKLLTDFRDGVYFVALEHVSDPAMLVPSIARACGYETVNSSAWEGSSLAQVLVQKFRTARMLLILDNCEQLMEAMHEIENLVTGTSLLKVIVTSRDEVPMANSARIALPKLQWPEPNKAQSLSAEELLKYPAMKLFMRCAKGTNQKFAISEEDLWAVAEICERLDGIPLAIEIVAPHVNMFDPPSAPALLKWMDRKSNSGTKIIDVPNKVKPPRHRTMRAVIEWSHNLLKEKPSDEKLFVYSSVFVGGFTSDAAIKVFNQVDSSLDVPDILWSLEKHNLLKKVNMPDKRIVMSPVIHEYVTEELKGQEAEAKVRECHAHYFLELAEGTESQLYGPEQRRALVALECDHNNMLAALRWLKESGEVELGLRLAGALGHFWYVRGYLSEGQPYLAELIALHERLGLPKLSSYYAKALRAAASLSREQSDYTRADALLRESLDIYTQLGEHVNRAWVLYLLGNLNHELRNLEVAHNFYFQSLEIRKELDDEWGMAAAYYGLGHIELFNGEFEKAEENYQQSVDKYRNLDQRGYALSLVIGLGRVAWRKHDFQCVEELCSEGKEISVALGDRFLIASSNFGLGLVERSKKNYAQAESLFVESIETFWQLGALAPVAHCLEELAFTTIQTIDEMVEPRDHDALEYAAQLYGAAESLRNAVKFHRSHSEEIENIEFMSESTSIQQNRHNWKAAFEKGQQMELDAIISLISRGKKA